MEDEAHAKLLSMKAGGKMKAVYVDTKEQLDRVRKARAGGFCKEVRRRWHEGGGGCARCHAWK